MADPVFVNSLYLNVLARDPDAAGATYWLGRISGGTTYDEVRDAFLNSAEAQTFVNPVVRLYEGFFNRAPDAAGLKYWADALRGGTTLNSITDAFLHSSEAQSTGFGDSLSNAEFVNNLYLSMGRSQPQIDADTGGVNYWLDALNSNALSRATVAQAFMESAENLQHSSGFVTGWATLRADGNPEPTTAQVNAFLADQDFVRGLYLNVLARDPDAGGANYWVHQISGGATHATVTAAFLNSPEAQTFINPVVRLYEGLLNRAPDTGGLNYWADALRGGASLNSITDAFLHSPEGATNGFGDSATNAQFVNSLYLSIGRSQAQIGADTDGVNYWLNALISNTLSRATVAQAFMESAENVQNSKGFVLGWEALRALGNPGPTTAQLNAFSDTATIDQIIASAGTVGTSTTALPTGPGVSSQDLAGTAANLAAADPAVLNGATNITATTPATVEQATIIDAATNSGTTTYSISDTGANLAGASVPVLSGAASIDASDGAVTLTGAQVTDAIIGKFAADDQLTLNGTGAALAGLTATALGAANVAALNASDNAVTLSGEQVTAAIIGKFAADDQLTLNGTGAALAGLTATALGAANVAALNASDNAVTLSGEQVTAAIIGKFAADDQLTLNGTGAALAGLTATALGAANVAALNASDNAVTLSGEQVTAAIIGKFAADDQLTLSATGATLSALSASTLGAANTTLVAIDALENQVTLVGDQVTQTIIGKFGPDVDLALQAPGATLAALPTATLAALNITLNASDDQVTLTGDKLIDNIIGKFDASDILTLTGTGAQLSALSTEALGNHVVTLNANDDAIMLTSAQFSALVSHGGLIDGTDRITITSEPSLQELDLDGAGGASGVTLVFNSLDGPDDIHNLAADDGLRFSKAIFTAESLPSAGVHITPDQLWSAADLTGAGDEGSATTRFLYDTVSGNLFYDADGNAATGGAVQIAVLSSDALGNHPVLTENDFIMIA